MKKLIAFFISIVFITKLVALDDFAANIAYEKAKSLVQKEEAIGKAYKEYILQKALIPTFATLISNGNLQDGFSIINDFGKVITLNYDATNKISYIENEINVDTKSITKFYDFYYSNKNRIYTQAPVSLDSKVVKINLSKIESFALQSQDNLLTSDQNLTSAELANKYLLENGVVTSYDASGNKEFTYNGKDIIIHNVVALLTSNETISKLLDLGFLSVGSIIYMIDGNSLIQVIYLGDETFKQLGGTGSTSNGGFANALLQITPYSGGYLLNGDIYSWGNNDKNITTINTKNYVDISTDKTTKASLASVVKLKSKNTDSAIASQNYFSAPSRNKYVEFYSSSNAGTCAITLDYKLYCTVVENGELMLNHIAFFDGATIKANKVVFYNGKWYVLVNGGKDNYDTYVGAKLYSFPQNVLSTTTPTLVDENNNYKDIQVGNELYLLNNEGKINSINSSGTIAQATNSYDVFVSLNSSPNGVIAKTNQGNSYYVYDNNGFSVSSIDTKIISHTQYEQQEQIVYSDAIVSNNTLKVVWINGDGKIKGDVNVLNYSSSLDDYKKLEYALISSSWKKIKFVTENTICAINDSYQLYCWGNVGFNNGSILPIINSNQFDKFIEDGNDVSSYKLKYPTYINGFNYDFIFK